MSKVGFPLCSRPRDLLVAKHYPRKYPNGLPQSPRWHESMAARLDIAGLICSQICITSMQKHILSMISIEEALIDFNIILKHNDI